ncbi:Transposase, Mutator family [Roseateles sp. YR242]|nr:Transposase, Mutator family [Roseateles sp. YR242]
MPSQKKPAAAGTTAPPSIPKELIEKLTEDGPLRSEVPQDRAGHFEPISIPKLERRFTGFADKIVAMYARGMTVREIQGFLAEQYGTDLCGVGSSESASPVWSLEHRNSDSPGPGHSILLDYDFSRCNSEGSTTAM